MDQPEIWGRAYNFSIETPLSVLEITEQVLIAMGRQDLRPVILNQAKAEIQEQYLSAARARQELNWKPMHTLEESLAETVAWYRTWFDQSA
jgi:CDP-glucose 4,6-dehydratase